MLPCYLYPTPLWVCFHFRSLVVFQWGSVSDKLSQSFSEINLLLLNNSLPEYDSWLAINLPSVFWRYIADKPAVSLIIFICRSLVFSLWLILRYSVFNVLQIHYNVSWFAFVLILILLKTQDASYNWWFMSQLYSIFKISQPSSFEYCLKCLYSLCRNPGRNILDFPILLVSVNFHFIFSFSISMILSGWFSQINLPVY